MKPSAKKISGRHKRGPLGTKPPVKIELVYKGGPASARAERPRTKDWPAIRGRPKSRE
jgi:hypothetical protein